MRDSIREAHDSDRGREPSLRTVLGIARPHLRPYRLQLLAIAACALTGAIAGLVPALATRSLVDQLARQGHAPWAHVVILVALSTAATLLMSAVFTGQSYLVATVSQGVIRGLRERVFGRLISQPPGFFTEHRAGELMTVITNDIEQVDDAISDVMLNIVTNLVVAVSTLALMFAMDWRLTLVSVALVPLGAFPSRRLARRNFRAQDEVQDRRGALTTYLHEFLGLSGIQLIKAFGTERAEQSRFAAVCLALSTAERRHALVLSSVQLVVSGLMGIGQWIVWLAGGLLVASGQASLGTVVAFVTILLSRMGTSVGAVSNIHVVLGGARAITGRVARWLDEPIRCPAGPAELAAVSGHIVLDGVSYAYPPDGIPALDGISLDVCPGEVLAVVGQSGAGKTTLANLICRFIDPASGTVSIDGVDVRQLTSASLRAAVGVVIQETFLFHGSILENIRYAKPDATDQEIVAAARLAHAHDFITGLPAGYETVVGERGHRLSGGERQRIAIARVLVKGPPILILDEATSSVDSVAERLIQQALEPLMATRTCVVIAHRLSTVLAADRIAVLDGGRLVGLGTHRALLEENTCYQTLFRTQFAAASSPAAPEAAMEAG